MLSVDEDKSVTAADRLHLRSGFAYHRVILSGDEFGRIQANSVEKFD